MANVSNIMLSELSSRKRELAIRMALGADWKQLAAYFFGRSILLSLAAVVGALLLTSAGFRIIFVVAPLAIQTLQPSLTANVITFMGVVSASVGIFIGVITTVQHSTGAPHQIIRQGMWGVGGSAAMHGMGGGRLRSALVLAQIVFATIVMVSATALSHKLYSLQNVAWGYDDEQVVFAQFVMAPVDDAEKHATQRVLLFQDLVELVNGIPQFQSAAVASDIPIPNKMGRVSIQIEGLPELLNGETLMTPRKHYVSPDYFPSLSVPLLAGRDFGVSDSIGAQAVAIVDRTFARYFWPNDDPIGKRLRFDTDSGWVTVVGVVGSVRYGDVDEPLQAEVYVPIFQEPRDEAYLVVRSGLDADRIGTILRRRISELNRGGLTLIDVRRLSSVVAESMSGTRFATLLSVSLGFIANLIALCGVYAVVTASVKARLHEFAIRLACGASYCRIYFGAIRRITMLAVLGMVVGLSLGSLMLERLSLFTNETNVTLSLLTAGLLVAGATLFGILVPALRVRVIEPSTLLKQV